MVSEVAAEASVDPAWSGQTEMYDSLMMVMTGGETDSFVLLLDVVVAAVLWDQHEPGILGKAVLDIAVINTLGIAVVHCTPVWTKMIENTNYESHENHDECCKSCSKTY